MLAWKDILMEEFLRYCNVIRRAMNFKADCPFPFPSQQICQRSRCKFFPVKYQSCWGQWIPKTVESLARQTHWSEGDSGLFYKYPPLYSTGSCSKTWCMFQSNMCLQILYLIFHIPGEMLLKDCITQTGNLWKSPIDIRSCSQHSALQREGVVHPQLSLKLLQQGEETLIILQMVEGRRAWLTDTSIQDRLI